MFNNRLSVRKALRTHSYLKSKYDNFLKKNEKVIEQHRVNEIALERIEKQTWVYVNCSHCGKMYLINFGDYLKKPLIYKDWVCYNCEQKIIDEKLKLKHVTHYHFNVYELEFPSGARFYYGRFSDGTLNGFQRRICDMLGRKMYEVD